MRGVASSCLLVCVTLASASASAEADAAPDVAALRAEAWSLRIEPYAGLGMTVDGESQVVVGGDVLVRRGVLQGGALCQYAVAVEAPWGTACGGMAGVAPWVGDVRLDLLAVLGARHWSQAEGRPLFSGDPGGEGTVAFAGLRAGVSWYIGMFALSAWLGFDDDLERRHVTYTYEDRDLIGSGSRQMTGEAVVGTATFFAAIRAGVEWNWL